MTEAKYMRQPGRRAKLSNKQKTRIFSLREEFRVLKVIIHEDYNPDTKANDIALLHLGETTQMFWLIY